MCRQKCLLCVSHYEEIHHLKKGKKEVRNSKKHRSIMHHLLIPLSRRRRQFHSSKAALIKICWRAMKIDKLPPHAARRRQKAVLRRADEKDHKWRIG
jgi:hypothetical protein